MDKPVGTRCEQGGEERFGLVMASTSIQIPEVLRTEAAGLGGEMDAKELSVQ